MWKRCAIGLMVLMIFTIQIAIASAAEHAHAALANDSGGLSHQELSTEEIEKCLGEWGCGHAELHRNGVVEELQKLTGGKCCDGEDSGECRITKINIVNRTVILNEQVCPLYSGIYPVTLERFRRPGIHSGLCI
jgi:hypothetical protein